MSGDFSSRYNRALHEFSCVLAVCTFLLIVAGALVTSNDAGLAVPDWPTSFGSLVKMPPMIGGIKYEHGHRMAAELIGFLSIILALWTWRAETRSWMRKFALCALAAVIVQGIIGGITVKFFLPPLVSSLHAAGGQTIFCMTVVFALFTSRKWMVEDAAVYPDSRHPGLATLAWLSVAAIYVQLILGAMFRHHGMALAPHLINAVLTTAILLWTIIRALTGYPQARQLRRPAAILAGLLILQLALGGTAYVTRVIWAPNEPQPTLHLVAATVAHVAVGALLLATSVALAVQATRLTRARRSENASAAVRAVTA